MLGHIAIAAMGGCFSQNPDTGAAEATYFPAESITLQSAAKMSVRREADTTDFTSGFTQTRFWTKTQFININPSIWPKFAMLGVDTPDSYKPRAWVGFMINSYGQVMHIANESYAYVSQVINPTKIWTCSKEAGTDTSLMTDGVTTSWRTTKDNPASRASYSFVFYFGTEGVSRFWGTTMQNEAYGIHARWQPMLCAETSAVAIFDADRKQLTEY